MHRGVRQQKQGGAMQGDGKATTSPRSLWSYSSRDICGDFSRILHQGRSPAIEDFLPSARAKDRTALLYGLLAREVAYRRSIGEAPSLKEYRARFPEDKALLDALLVVPEKIRDWLNSSGYDLLEHIGTPLVGEVYKVRRQVSGDIQAATVIPRFFGRKQLFEDPQSAELGYLLHPHLARPRQLLDIEGNLILVSDFISGVTFRQFISNGARVPVGVACELVRQAAAGVAQLHEHFDVHGTLNPECLFLCRAGPEAGTVKVSGVALNCLADLHLARYAPPPASADGRDNAVDRERFMAPECARSADDCDAHSDVYSLGCVLLSLLLGRLPFRISIRRDLAIEHEGGPDGSGPGLGQVGVASILSRERDDIPRGLEAIVERALAVNGEARYATAKELVEQLAPYSDGEALQDWFHSLSSHHLSPAEQSAPCSDRDALQKQRAEVAHDGDAEEKSASRPTASAGASGDAPPADAPAWYQRTSSTICDVAQAFSGRKTARSTRLLGLGLAIAAVAAAVLFVSRSSDEADPVTTLAELPGPSGEWWFKESPWYVPAIRSRLARLSDEEQALRQECEGLIECYVSQPILTGRQLDRLRTISEQLAETLRGPERAAVTRLTNIRFNRMRSEKFKKECSWAVADLVDANSATGVHLRAVLQHFLSENQRAKEDYEEAIRKYKEAGRPSLRALCATDFAHLLINNLYDYNLATIRLEQDALPSAESPALKIEAQCLRAEAFRKLKEFNQAAKAIASARQILRDLNWPNTSHLEARVVETEAWLALDRWNLNEAQKLFAKAVSLRQEHREYGCQRAKLHWCWDQQGLAMVQHFLGAQEKASETLSEVIEQVRASLDAADLPVNLREQLGARLPNLAERLGDCYLFGPSYDYQQACEHYREAVESATGTEYGRYFDMESNWPHIVRLRYKRVVALVKAGELETAEACLQDIDAFVSAKEPAGSSPEPDLFDRQEAVFDWNRKLAKRVLRTRSESRDERRRALASLGSLLPRGEAPRRQNLNMRLLLCELLTQHHDTSQRDSLCAATEVNYLMDWSVQKIEGRTRYFARYVRSARPVATELAKTSKQRQDQKLEERLLDHERGFQEDVPSDVPDADTQPVRLHTLTVGVSDYKGGGLDLKSGARDADVLHETFGFLYKEAEKGGIFKHGIRQKLLDEQVTRENIYKFYEELNEEGSSLEKDMVIISLAGHAVREDNGLYYLCSNAASPQGKLQLRAKGLDISRFKSHLAQLGTKVLLILDCCHAGAAFDAPQLAMNRALSERELIEAVSAVAESEPAVAVLAASLGNESASESPAYAGHGALSAAVIEYIRQEHFDITTEANLKPVQLRPIRHPEHWLTLEELERYVIDRLRQFPHLEQHPKLNVVVGPGRFNEAAIYLRSVSSTE